MARQVSVTGSYRPPVLSAAAFPWFPPQTIISRPVQTAFARWRPGGRLPRLPLSHWSAPMQPLDSGADAGGIASSKEEEIDPEAYDGSPSLSLLSRGANGKAITVDSSRSASTEAHHASRVIAFPPGRLSIPGEKWPASRRSARTGRTKHS